jgi:hypothetical protein
VFFGGGGCGGFEDMGGGGGGGTPSGDEVDSILDELTEGAGGGSLVFE